MNGSSIIKNPKFRYLRNDSKVYYISKRGVCFGSNMYFTLPVKIRSSFTNCLVGYTNESVANNTLANLQKTQGTQDTGGVHGCDTCVYNTTCKDLHYISTVLKLPLVVVMDPDTDTDIHPDVNVFFKLNNND
ncbi:MAG: hypothetical protein EBU90_10230 [Proteobacteria bacterium]|nr:hypothetical protein [Pseudomonadota bacterium]NBP13786.1 hypothetical protein [bacterium]